MTRNRYLGIHIPDLFCPLIYLWLPGMIEVVRLQVEWVRLVLMVEHIRKIITEQLIPVQQAQQ